MKEAFDVIFKLEKKYRSKFKYLKKELDECLSKHENEKNDMLKIIENLNNSLMQFILKVFQNKNPCL